MKKILATFLAGVLIVAPIAVTAWVVIWLGGWLDRAGRSLIDSAWSDAPTFPGLGAIVIIVGIYLVGLMTRLWVFRSLLSLLDRMIARVPGVKTIYESVRDLMKLFGGDAQRMGKAVKYTPPGTDVSLLGIMTNQRPAGMSDGDDGLVAIYLPYAYMFGGPTIYVPRKDVTELDISVDQALKLATTAHVGMETLPAPAESNAE